jgi:hypothetical protein
MGMLGRSFSVIARIWTGHLPLFEALFFYVIKYQMCIDIKPEHNYIILSCVIQRISHMYRPLLGCYQVTLSLQSNCIMQSFDVRQSCDEEEVCRGSMQGTGWNTQQCDVVGCILMFLDYDCISMFGTMQGWVWASGGIDGNRVGVSWGCWTISESNLCL